MKLVFTIFYDYAKGATAHAQSLFATQPTSSFMQRLTAATKAAAQSVVAFLTKQAATARIAAQGMAAVLVKQVGAIRVATQGMAATLSSTKVILRTLLAVQAQSALLNNLIGAIRTAAQATSTTFVKTAQLTRVAGQAMTSTLTRQAQRILLAVQGELAALTKLVMTTKVAGQAQAAAMSTLRVFLRTIFATQATAALLTRQVQAIRIAGQAAPAALTKLVAVIKLAAQAQASAVVKQVGKILLAVQTSAATEVVSRLLFRTLLATQATVAQLTATLVRLKTLLASQASSALETKQVQAVRAALQAATASTTKATAHTLVAAQAMTPAVSKFIARLVRAVQSAIASLSEFLPGAPAPRTIALLASLNTTSALAASAATVLPYYGAVRALNPVAYWRMDDPKQADGSFLATDLVAGNTGTAPAGAGITTQVSGAITEGDPAMQFDGTTNAHLTIPSSPTFTTITGPMTIVAWLKIPIGVSQGGTQVQLVGWKSGTNCGLGLSNGLLPMQNAVFQLNFGGQNVSLSVALGTGVNFIDGTWHMLAGVYDGTESLLYIDGVEKTASFPFGGAVDMGTVGLTFAISENASSLRPFKGMLDEIALFSTNLSSTQIAALYALRTAAKTAPSFPASADTTFSLPASEAA